MEVIEDKDDNKKKSFNFDKIILNKGIIQIIEKTLKENEDLSIATELTWTLLNMVNFPSKHCKYEYFLHFFTDDYINIYKKLIPFHKGDITENIFTFLANLCIENKECRHLLIKNNILSISFSAFKSSSNNYDEFLAGLHFCSNITLNVSELQREGKTLLLNLFDSLIREGVECDLLITAIKGVFNILVYDEESEIKQSIDYISAKGTIEKIMAIDIFKIQTEHIESLHVMIYFIFNLISVIIERKESEKDLYDFIVKYDIFTHFDIIFHSTKMTNIYRPILQTVMRIVMRLNETITKAFMTHSFFITVQNLLLNYAFEIRKITAEITLNCLMINNFDITSVIYNTNIIDIIINSLLLNESDSLMIQISLECILYYLKSGSMFGAENPFLKDCLNKGIEDVLLKSENLTDENMKLVEEINKIISNYK